MLGLGKQVAYFERYNSNMDKCRQYIYKITMLDFQAKIKISHILMGNILE